MAIDWNNISEAGQATDLEIGTTLSGYDLVIRVHHDRSHPAQSWAKVSVWHAPSLAWNVVATYHWAEWARLTTPESGATEGIWEAEAELLSRALAVLKG